MNVMVLLEKKQYGFANLHIPDEDLEGRSSNARKKLINQTIKNAFENNDLETV